MPSRAILVRVQHPKEPQRDTVMVLTVPMSSNTIVPGMEIQIGEDISRPVEKVKLALPQDDLTAVIAPELPEDEESFLLYVKMYKEQKFQEAKSEKHLLLAERAIVKEQVGRRTIKTVLEENLQHIPFPATAAEICYLLKSDHPLIETPAGVDAACKQLVKEGKLTQVTDQGRVVYQT